MAQSITDSFKELEKQLDSLTSKFERLGLGVQQREKFDKSKSLAKAEALVGNNAYLTSAYGILGHVKNIQRAQLYMESHPDKFKTPDRFIAWENKVRQRSKESFARSQEVRDKILSIENPEAYHKIQLIRKYGDVEAGKLIRAENIEKTAKERRREIDKEMSITDPEKYKRRRYHDEYGWFGSQRILAAEQNERVRLAKIGIANRKAAGRYAYNLATMSEKDRKFHDLTMLFGSGEQGRRLAALKIQSDQDEEEAKERRLRDSRRSIAVRRMQIDAYKKFPWVKTLVDAGVIQKKELPKIVKYLSRTSKIPFIGSLLRNPGVGLAGLIAGLTHLIGSSARAAVQVLPWQNLEIAGGKVAEDYKSLMASVGLGEKEAITSATGRKRLIAGWKRAQGLEAFAQGALYGIMPTAGMFSMTHDQLLDYVSRQAYGISDDGMRLNALAAYGINEAEYSASIQRQGLQKKTTANYVSQAAQRAKDRKAKTIAAGGWWANITHPDWAIDFLSSIMPTDPIHGREWKRMLDEEQKAQSAAESAEEYERNKGSTRQSSNSEATSAGNQVSFNINSVNVDANNYEEFIQSIASEAGMRYNIDVMEWADSRRVKG